MVFPYKWFRLPWAVAGTKVTIPDPTQGDGTCSYNEGFGANYSLDPATNPSALLIPRDKTNELYYDITQALQYIQSGKWPAWIDASTNGGSSYPYAIGDLVLYTDGIIYQSLTAANVTTPGTDITKWVPAGGISGHQYNPGTFYSDTGAVNAAVITPVPAILGYVSGQVFRFIPAFQNTSTAPTINVNGLGIKTIVSASGAVLSPGDIPAGGVCTIVYNAVAGKFFLQTTTNAQASLASSSGYFRVPGTRVLIQWSSYSVTTTRTNNQPGNTVWEVQTNVAWPLTFPNACLVSWAVPYIKANGNFAFAITPGGTVSSNDVYATVWADASVGQPQYGNIIGIGW